MSDKEELWCVDWGHHADEERYCGPWLDRREADRVLSEERDAHPSARVRRCRRVPVPPVDLDRIEDEIGDDLSSPADPETWACWDDALVEIVDRDAAQRELDAWARRHLRPKAFICEPDVEDRS